MRVVVQKEIFTVAASGQYSVNFSRLLSDGDVIKKVRVVIDGSYDSGASCDANDTYLICRVPANAISQGALSESIEFGSSNDQMNALPLVMNQNNSNTRVFVFETSELNFRVVNASNAIFSNEFFINVVSVESLHIYTTLYLE